MDQQSVIWKTTKFILAIFIIVIFLVAGAWGLWVMFFTWGFNRDYYRLIVIATSVFWLAVGGLLWLVPRR